MERHCLFRSTSKAKFLKDMQSKKVQITFQSLVVNTAMFTSLAPYRAGLYQYIYIKQGLTAVVGSTPYILAVVQRTGDGVSA